MLSFSRKLYAGRYMKNSDWKCIHSMKIQNNKRFRYLSSLAAREQSKISTNYTKEDAQSFKLMFPVISQDIVESVKDYDDEVCSYVEKSMKYNVAGGRNNRGQITILAFKALADKSQLTAENLKLAQYVSWCSEMFEAPLFVADDIVDGSEMRRGVPCWHTLEDVGLQSVNDILFLENAVFIALKKYIGKTPYYTKMCETFGEANFMTNLGQLLDVHITKDNILNHTMERYDGLVKYKTCYPAFYLPVALALQMCGYTDPAIYNEAKSVLYEIGTFFQIRNDYLDIYGDPAKTGKNGTDIQENKASWLAIRTLEKANKKQREIMRTCYGQEDPDKVAKVKALCKELGVVDEFLTYEKDSYERVSKMIENTKFSKLKPVFRTVWERIYSRNLR